MLISLGIGKFHPQVCVEDAKEYFKNTETCYKESFATQSKHDSIFFVGFYIENTLHLKYQKQKKMFWLKWDYWYTPSLRERLDTLVNILSFLCISANWSENWRTEGSEVAANTLHCESTKGPCLQSHSVLVCKQMCHHEALSSGLQCWSAVRWTLCLPLFPNTNLALFTKLCGVQRSFTCIHIHCKLIYKSMFTLRVKAKWSSDLLSFQLWVKLHLLEKDIKQCCVCFSLLLQSHHSTLVHSFLSINAFFVFTKGFLNCSFSAAFISLIAM